MKEFSPTPSSFESEGHDSSGIDNFLDYLEALDEPKKQETISSGKNWYGISGRGSKNTHGIPLENEDRFGVFENYLLDNPELSGSLFMIADGFQGGAKVADAVVKFFPTFLKDGLEQYWVTGIEKTLNTSEKDLRLLFAYKTMQLAFQNTQTFVAHEINNQRLARSVVPKNYKVKPNFGTTLSIAYVNHKYDYVLFGGVGDSPVYYSNASKTRRCLDLHSKPGSNALVQAIASQQKQLFPSANVLRLKNRKLGQRIIMGTDPLKQTLSIDRIHQLHRDASNRATLADHLYTEALTAGDNTTVAVIDPLLS